MIYNKSNNTDKSLVAISYTGANSYYMTSIKYNIFLT